MKRISEILNTIQTDAEAALPALLTAAGLTDFHEYVIGPSRKRDELALCVYVDEASHDESEDRVNLIIQLQLYFSNLAASVNAYDHGIKYQDTVHAYLRTYRPQRIGMSLLDGITIDTWPIDNNRTMFVYFALSYSKPLDSCDRED